MDKPKTSEELIAESQRMLRATQQRMAQNGYRVSEINKAALEYIRVAKGLNLNCTEFTYSLNKATEIVRQSTSGLSLSDLNIEDASSSSDICDILNKNM